MSTDTSLIIFKAISNFTTCLDEVFGQFHRPLKLYAHLISKTTVSHEKPIQKHIDVFREFCINNREGITTKDFVKFKQKCITYSNRVYIDVNVILKEADNVSATIIWKHILTISALIDPAGKAREVLEESVKNGEKNAKEADFLSNIIGQVEQHVDPDANPMEAVSSIMKSGIFTELVGGMGNGLQDGSLDLGKLMGTVQKMVSTLNDVPGEISKDQNGGSEDLLNTMMSNLTAGSSSNNSSQATPDIGALIGMMGPMLGALGNQNSGGLPGGLPGGPRPSTGNDIEDKIEQQLQMAKKSGKFSPSINKISENIEEVEKVTDID